MIPAGRSIGVAVVILLALMCIGCSEDNADTGELPTDLIQPSDLRYLGAFRLPGGSHGSEVKNWAYGGHAMTYLPDGDPSGPDDGYPGSLIASGHAWEHQFSEISIPVPVVSQSKNPNDLNTAATLQEFHDILLVGHLEIPRVGLALIPAQGSGTEEKLHFCWGAHLQEGGETHGWCELDLARPDVRRGWHVGCPDCTYSTNDYMFGFPRNWADAHLTGKSLATGRFRDGGWSGQGPALFVVAPWEHGDPPPVGTGLECITLIRYTSSEDFSGEAHTMTGYHHSDEWSGAVWAEHGGKAAVVFVGTKGTGDCWYGDADGPCLDCDGERGWWSTGFEGWLIFFSPADLADVAAGIMEAWEPQPYAHLNVDDRLFHITSDRQWHHLGAASFDRETGRLYVFEPFGDGEHPIIHVWEVAP